MAIERWHIRNSDGSVEAVSRDEFFARTTPGQRLFWDRCQSESGADSIYLSAEEWAVDAVAVDVGAGMDRRTTEAFVRHYTQYWRPNYGKPRTRDAA